MTPQDKAQRHLERLDVVIRASEIKWGLFRLETLVPEDLAAKFKRQWDGLSLAITEARHEDVVVMADGAIRGIWAMEKTAMGAGCDPEALLPFGAVAEKPKDGYILDKTLRSMPPEFWAGGGDSIPF